MNAERKAKWREEHAAFLAKHAQGDLFAVNTSEPPAEPAELTELPFPAFGTKRADKEPATFRNRIVARLAPAYYFGRVSQPALMVWSDRQLTRADIEGMLSQSFVRPAIEATADQFAKAKRSAAQVSVHTSPVTVRGQESRTPHLPALLRPGTWQKQAEPALC